MDDIHYREYKVLLQPNQFSDPSRFEEYWHAVCRIAETCGVGAATNKNAFHRLIREVLFYDTNRFEGRDRYKTMTLATGEFIRRFLIHVLPKGLHRIRHYGLFANGPRAENVGRARELLVVPPPATNPEKPAETETGESSSLSYPCPYCGGRMLIIETFERGSAPRYRPTAPTAAIRIDTS